MELELNLNSTERAHLAAVVQMEGFKVIQRILEHEAERFWLRLVNTDESDHEAVIARHKLAKAAAQVVAGGLHRINEEMTLAVAMPKLSDKPQDITEGLIDIGEIASSLPDFGLSARGFLEEQVV